MPNNQLQHSHTFGQELRRPGEARTLLVIGLTGVMMVVELVAGALFGSMALLADGLHMASHTAALSINAFAYVYARRQARNTAYSFGTGKINALGGFSGAVLLAVFALYMAWESVNRLVNPVEIIFNQAIVVAFAGLVVNGLSVLILGVDEDHQGEAHGQGEASSNHDHNLRSAYLHVLADALTSILAIVALLAAKYFGFIWMDPVMGLVGAALVSWWSFGLLRSSSAVLLDRQGPQAIVEAIRASIEGDGCSRVTDLHLWSIGPNIYAAIVAVAAPDPAAADDYKARLPGDLGLAHVTIEVHRQASTDGAN